MTKRTFTFTSVSLFLALCSFMLVVFGFVFGRQAYADEVTNAAESTTSSSLRSTVDYEMTYPVYKTANNRRWNSSTGKYYYITDSMNYTTTWRLYNPYSGEHLFTQDYDEYSYLGTIGWRKEDIAWISPTSSKTEVYRLYNPYSGDHHYTTKLDEYNYLETIGWRKEGVGFYSDDAKGVPVYRLFNRYVSVGTHHYTTDQSEYSYLGTIGWRQEGRGWYGAKHTHTYATVEYADLSSSNSIRYVKFCPEHGCEVLSDSQKWSDTGGDCPANKNCLYNRIWLYVHKTTMCTTCGALK